MAQVLYVPIETQVNDFITVTSSVEWSGVEWLDISTHSKMRPFLLEPPTPYYHPFVMHAPGISTSNQ